MRSDLLALIDTDRLAHNYRALRACCRPGVKLCAALKADAYGHGLQVVAPALHAAGADYAAVATVQEALALRELRWDRPILVLGNVLAVADETERRERLKAIIASRLCITLAEMETAARLAALDVNTPIDVHVKVDSGMGRMGLPPEQAAELTRFVQQHPTRLRLAGIYSHFATADFEKPELARSQLAVFRQLLDDIGGLLPPGVIRHLANSAATIAMPDAHLDMVRPGLALYGYLPGEHMAGRIDLRPILRLDSHLSAIKELPANHCIGYGQTFTTNRPTRLGIVPIGYFDGYLRALSNCAVVSTPRGDAPVVGRVSMDQLAVDLTDLGQLGLGDRVTLIDERPDRPNSVASIARRLGTIPYEVTCLLGQRIERQATRNFCASPKFPVN